MRGLVRVEAEVEGGGKEEKTHEQRERESRSIVPPMGLFLRFIALNSPLKQWFAS